MSADLDRRTLLAGAAAAGVPEIAPFVRPAQAASAPAGADANLLALRPLWQAAEARCNEADRLVNEADDRYERLPLPDALYERLDDMEIFGHHIGQLGLCSEQPSKRSIDFPEQIEAFEAAITRMRSSPHAVFTQRSQRLIARMQEVLTFLAEWRAENKRRRQRSGLEAAEQSWTVAATEARAVRLRIAKEPSCTPEGLALKVEVFLSCWSGEFEDECTELVEHGGGADESLIASIILDLCRAHTKGRA